MMMVMPGRRVNPLTGCVILQINCDYYACITSGTASDYEDECLQMRNAGTETAELLWSPVTAKTHCL